MLRVRKLLLLVLVLAVVLAAVVFVLENLQPVTLVVLGYTGPQMPVALPVIVAFLVGMLIGPMLALIFRLRRRPKKPTVANRAV